MEMKKLVKPSALPVAVLLLGAAAYGPGFYRYHQMTEAFGAELNRIVPIIGGVSASVKSGKCSVKRPDPALTGLDIDCTDGGQGYTSRNNGEKTFLFRDSQGDYTTFGRDQFYYPYSKETIINYAQAGYISCIIDSYTFALKCAEKGGDGTYSHPVKVSNEKILKLIKDSRILEVIAELQGLEKNSN